MAEYYVVRDKNTGLYFRGKGVNRWGKYYNQASIYRIKANAENTIKEVSWRGEQAEVVPIQIIENTVDVVPKSEVERLEQDNEDLRNVLANTINKYRNCESEVAREIFEEIEKLSRKFMNDQHYIFGDMLWDISELKKKYIEN